MLRLVINLTGRDAQQALRTIDEQGGHIIAVLPQEEGERILYLLPNGDRCSISTNPIPSFGGIESFGAAIDEHIDARADAGYVAGYSVDDLLGAHA